METAPLEATPLKKGTTMINTPRVPDLPEAPDPWADDAWAPKEGDGIVGTVTARETVDSPKLGKEFEILTVTNGNGEETKVLCGRVHLASLIAEHDPQPGDGIAIRYFGPRAGERTHLYAMRVTKGGDHDLGY
jgi:hypothetical protein